MRKIVIGDIHGCFLTLKKLLEEKVKIKADDELYFVGDYVDRGPQSKHVIDYILDLKEKQPKVICLRGNHEQLMLDSVNGDAEFKHWMKNGGDETLGSFGAETINDLDEKYQLFFDTLDYYCEEDHYIIVHAGLNFMLQNPFEDFYSMMWIRKFPVDEKWLNGRILVHGHTTKRKTLIKEDFENPECSVINIDSGCIYNHKQGLGNLCAFDMMNRKLFFQKKVDGPSGK